MEVKNYIKKSISAKNLILNNNDFIINIEKIADTIIEAYKNNKKVLIAGNGGSASDSNHIAAELVGKFLKERKSLSAISLNTNTSIMTAIANDYTYSDIFSRQIEALGHNGDIFIAISTSGNSENIINGLNKAKEKNIITIGLTGQNDCKMDKLCNYIIKVPSSETPIIQESHIMIGHIICAIIEEAF